ncbi:MAG: alkyl hydroperoxide reductase [Maricaulis sp.]|nr:alkyl hydroperoxide reductase [Maricaulis sp.]HAQ36671.1 TlpA family protein disulfide reductase [Alphaproteobacteria bacterium]
MRMSPLKAGLIALPVIGIGLFLYVVFAAMDNPQHGAFTDYARGEMSQLQFLDNPPARSATPFVDGEGETHRLSDFDGQVVLLNLWATWCAPCVVEMPMLDALQQEFGGEDFQVVTISLDRSIEEPREFYADNGLTHLPLFHENTFAIATEAQARGLPMTILYNRRGMEIARMPRDADWSSDEARALIRAAIARE